MKQKHFIDTHKGITIAIILVLIIFYRQWANPTAWVYLALHGTYGLLWVLKSCLFPDRQWEQPTSLAYGFLIWSGLTLYWLAPWLITSRNTNAPNWYLSICISLTLFGIFFHFVSDMQKYVALQLQPNRLVKAGLWARCRNPNYFGEMLIYLGFSLLAMHWLPILVLVLFMSFVWYPNMRKKDHSLRRYPDFETYQKRSALLIPYLL